MQFVFLIWMLLGGKEVRPEVRPVPGRVQCPGGRPLPRRSVGAALGKEGTPSATEPRGSHKDGEVKR